MLVAAHGLAAQDPAHNGPVVSDLAHNGLVLVAQAERAVLAHKPVAAVAVARWGP